MNETEFNEVYSATMPPTSPTSPKSPKGVAFEPSETFNL